MADKNKTADDANPVDDTPTAETAVGTEIAGAPGDVFLLEQHDGSWEVQDGDDKAKSYSDKPGAYSAAEKLAKKSGGALTTVAVNGAIINRIPADQLSD